MFSCKVWCKTQISWAPSPVVFVLWAGVPHADRLVTREISHSECVDWLDWTAGQAHVYRISGSDVRQVTICNLRASSHQFSPTESFCQIAAESLAGLSLYFSLGASFDWELCCGDCSHRGYSPEILLGQGGNISQYWSDLDLVCTNITLHYNTEHINTGTDMERKIT